MDFISDTNGAVFSGILASAKASSSVRLIETRMLDGSFTVQTIGSAATWVSVEFYCSTETRRLLQLFAHSGQPVRVGYRDRIWTGLIRGGEIQWERWTRNHRELQEKLRFEVLVTEEAVQ